MDITDVRIRLLKGTSDRLKAFCTVTFDDEFVVRDIKIVDGTAGLFIAMPSKKVTFSCPTCRHRNQLRAKYCEECGQRLEEPSMGDGDGRDKLHRDMAHPITSEFRAKLQDRIIEAFNEEFANAGDPDHQPADEQESKEADPPASEYNDMIAGLNSGGDKRKSDEQGSSRRGGSDRSSRSEKPRGRRDHRDKPRREDQSSSDKPRAEKPASAKQHKPKPVDEDIPIEDEVVETTKFEDEVDVAKEVETTVASSDPNEDSTPFGSGIL